MNKLSKCCGAEVHLERQTDGAIMEICGHCLCEVVESKEEEPKEIAVITSILEAWQEEGKGYVDLTSFKGVAFEILKALNHDIPPADLLTDELKNKLMKILDSHATDTDGEYADSCRAVPISGQDYIDRNFQLLSQEIFNLFYPLAFEAGKKAQAKADRVEIEGLEQKVYSLLETNSKTLSEAYSKGMKQGAEEQRKRGIN